MLEALGLLPLRMQRFRTVYDGDLHLVHLQLCRAPKATYSVKGHFQVREGGPTNNSRPSGQGRLAGTKHDRRRSGFVCFRCSFRTHTTRLRTIAADSLSWLPVFPVCRLSSDPARSIKLSLPAVIKYVTGCELRNRVRGPKSDVENRPAIFCFGSTAVTFVSLIVRTAWDLDERAFSFVGATRRPASAFSKTFYNPGDYVNTKHQDSKRWISTTSQKKACLAGPSRPGKRECTCLIKLFSRTH